MNKIAKDKRKWLAYGSVGAALAGVGLWQYLPAALAESAGSTKKRKLGIKGQVMPDIKANYWIDASGQETSFSMQEVRNKWVFLKCFQNWCPGCHKHGFPTLKKVADAFADHPDVSILAIQTVFEGRFFNTQGAVRDLQKEYELPIKMGHDVGSDATDDYPETMIRFKTGGTPWIVVANPSGRVIYNHYHLNADKFINYLNRELRV